MKTRAKLLLLSLVAALAVVVGAVLIHAHDTAPPQASSTCFYVWKYYWGLGVRSELYCPSGGGGSW